MGFPRKTNGNYRDLGCGASRRASARQR
jgi:hypothetical protein